MEPGVQEQGHDRPTTAPSRPTVVSHAQTRWQRLRAELDAYWDTDVAIVLGVAVGLLGIFDITSLKTTVGLTLVVLATVAGSLHRDRSIREGLKESIKRLEVELSTVSRAFDSPLPYDLVSGLYEWDFRPGGEIADVRKRARARFLHNGVWSILQWHTSETDIQQAHAQRLLLDEGDGAAKPLVVFGDLDGLPKGRIGKLIALDREYRQGDVLDFEYLFQSHGTFCDGNEWVSIAIETATDDLTIEFLWAEDRIPRDVALIEDGNRKPLPVDQLEGRCRTRLRLRNLSRGQEVLIEWSWLSIRELHAT